MSDQSRGTPEVQSEPAVTPSAAPAATDSSFKAQVQKANSPQGVRALLDQARNAKIATPEPLPRQTEPGPWETQSTESTTEATPASEETPAEEISGEEPEAQSAETEGGEAEEDDGGDGPITPITAKRTHLRLAENDQVGRLAASYMKRNRDMPMQDALDKARLQLGIKPEKDAAQEPVKPASNLPPTVEAVDSAIDSLETERAKALTELRFEDVAKIDSSMRKLDRHRSNLERDSEKQLAKQVESYDRGFAASESKAVELYEFAAQPDSVGGKRMLQIEADLKANDDPLFNSPDKPLRIAQMVAAELSIAPRRKGAATPPAKAAAPVVPVPKKGVVPSGSNRTVPVATNQQPAINSEIRAAKSIGDLRKLHAKIGLPT